MNEKTKPNFKTENCGSAEIRAKNEYNSKLYLADLKRSLAEAEAEYESEPDQVFESIGEIMAKRRMWRASPADHDDGQVKNGFNPH